MAVLTKWIREQLGSFMREELQLVDHKAKEVAGTHWEKAEKKVAKDLGYEDALNKIEHIKNEISGLQEELTIIEGSMIEKARPASANDYEKCGLYVHLDSYGRPYHIPSVFGREIKTVWDVLVLQYLNEHFEFFKVYKNIKDIDHSVRRELLLAGTFEEARAMYMRFFNKVSDALGDDVPALLSQTNSIPRLTKGKDGS